MGRIAIWGLGVVGLLASGCAGLVGTGGARGACQAEHERCVAHCREDLERPHNCELACDHEARRCGRRQSEERLASNVEPIVAVTALGPTQTLAVDLRGGRIVAEGAHVNFDGPARAVDGAYQLDPGASLRLTFRVPADAREAVLTLLHGVGGEGVNCFVTVSVGEAPLLSRYAPPRPSGAGLLRAERWNVGFALPSRPDGDAPVDVTVYLYNNQPAGSRTPYLLAAAELSYRQPAAAK